MPLPSNLTTITLTGKFLDSTGAPLTGTISFTPPPELVDPANAIMYGATISATLDVSGAFSVTLLCTDNSALLPVGWFYTVTEHIAGTRSYPLYVPHTLGASADLSSLVPMPSLTGAPAVITTGVVAPGYGGLAYNQTWTGNNTFTGTVTLPGGYVPSGTANLTPTTVQTANYTAHAGELVLIDTTSANVQITLPTAPPDGTMIGLKLITSGAHTASFVTGGSDVFNKTGGSTSGTLTLPFQGLLAQYKASAAIWYVISDDLPLTQLDTRYLQTANALSELAATAATARGNLGLGSAATVAVPISIANGGTGQTSASAAFNALSPNTTLGDLTYASGANTNTRLAGNTTTAKQYLTQTGTGTVSAAPAWAAIAAADLPTGTTGTKGALQLDGTAGDMQSLGVANAGNSGLAADAKHVHPFASTVLTSTTTVTGVTTQTLLASGPTIAAGGIYAGMAYEVDIWGIVTTTASTQTIITILFLGGVGGTSLITLGPTQPSSSGTVTNAPYRFTARFAFPTATTCTASGEHYSNFFLNNNTQQSNTTVSVATAKQLVIALTPSATAVSLTVNGGFWRQLA